MIEFQIQNIYYIAPIIIYREKIKNTKTKIQKVKIKIDNIFLKEVNISE